MRTPRPSARPPGAASRRSGWAAGHTLTELLAVAAILGALTALAVPATGSMLRRARLRGASRELAMLFRRARTEAVLGNQHFGVVFDRTDRYAYSLYLDGNRNGIRRADIAAGIDRRIRGPVRIPEVHPGVEVRIAPPPPIPNIPPDPGSLDDLDDPVKFGPTDIVSFSPGGSCTSGTLYLSSGRERMAAVRVLGVTGRVALWEYTPRAGWDRR